MAYQKIGFKNGNVLTAEQLIHMEDGIINAEKKAASGSGTGTGLPSDVGAYKYMATDGNGDWVPADRLAWKETSSVMVYENENPDWGLTGLDVPDNSGYMIPRVNLNVYSSEVDVLEAGKYYNVTINGKTYKNLLCVEGNEWEDGLPARFIGNMAFVNDSIGSVPVTDDNGVPFCIGSCEWKLEVRYQFTEAEAFDGHGEWPTAADIMDSVALKIESVSETTHPIPAEYLTDEAPSAYKQLVTNADGKTVWEDRLAYETKTVIAWDGDTTGRVVVADMFCKVSDIVPQNLIGSLVWLNGDGQTVTESQIQSVGGVTVVAQHFYVVENDNTTVEGLFTFPEKGIYQSIQDGDGYVWDLSEITHIDPKFIPSDYLKVYNFPSQIASAEEAKKAIAEMLNYQLVSVGGELCAYETYEGISASYFYPIHANGVNPLEYFDTGYFGNSNEYPIDTSYLQNFTKKYHTLPEIYLRASDSSGTYKVTIDGTGTLVSTKM